MIVVVVSSLSSCQVNCCMCLVDIVSSSSSCHANCCSHPAHLSVVSFFENPAKIGLRDVETGGDVKNPHGLINLFHMRSTLLWYVGQGAI